MSGNMVVASLLPKIKKELDLYFLDNEVWTLNYHLGYLVFCGYYSLYKGNRQESNLILSRVSSCIQYLNSSPYQDISLFNGFSGLGWTLLHLNKIDVLSNRQVGFNIKQIDAVIEQELATSAPAISDLDLFYGLSGVGVYLLSKRPTKFTLQLISQVVEKMYVSIIRLKSSPHIDLGIPHGVAGIVIMMCRFFKMGIQIELTRNAITTCVDIIVSNKLAKDSLSIFPTNSTSNNVSRLAWCYGDMSILIALVRANQILKLDWINVEIKKILENCLSRKLNKSGVFKSPTQIDSGLCHGAFGIAYLFKKLNENIDEPSFEKAISYWMKIGFSRVSLKEKFLNLKTAFPEKSRMAWGYDGGLVDGLAGVGLMLISMENKELNGWDSLFLLDLE